MVLATRCPHCETVFRLEEEQLKLHGGLVRCGHCQNTFDASQNLVDPAPGANANASPNFSASGWDMWAPAAATDVDPALRHDLESLSRQPIIVPGALEPVPAANLSAAPGHTNGGSPNEEADEQREPSFVEPPAPAVGAAPAETGEPPESRTSEAPVVPAEPEPSEESSPPVEHRDEPTLQSVASQPAWHGDPEPRFGAPEPELTEPHFGTPAPEATEPRYGNAATAAAEPHIGAASAPFADEPFAAPAADEDMQRFAITREARAPAPRRVGWRIFGTFVALVLIVVLAAQLAWWRRETVMVYWPESQTLFARACVKLGCQISPPRDIDGLQVEASDLRQIDGPHRLELRVPLRNRYNVALAYPAMELTLFDDKNEIAIRRVLWPQDYVRPGTPIAAGLPARETQTMVVRLDSGNTVATNFRVQIFYP